jgi:predicted kinase
MSDRTHWIRQADADKIEKSLGRLPRKSQRLALIVLVGLPGSGKSHLAREIKRGVPAVILDSDALRQALFADTHHTQREHARLFPAIHVLMARLLERGITIIVDATNLKEANRRPFYKIAEDHGAKLVLARVWAPKRVIRQRMAARDTGANAADRSTATLDVYEKMLADAEPIRRRHISVDTSKDLGPAVDKIIRDLSASTHEPS